MFLGREVPSQKVLGCLGYVVPCVVSVFFFFFLGGEMGTFLEGGTG